jgi:GT2 family glycosyltransferase
MTATYQIPESRSNGANFRSRPVDPRKIHAIIPTFNDWDGLRTTLDSLRRLNPAPQKITVVNDNHSKNQPPDWLKTYRVDTVSDYQGNLGPAAARNLGFGFPPSYNFNLVVSGQGQQYLRHKRREWREDSRLQFNPVKPSEFQWRHDIEWFYFTDCGCEHTPNLFSEFEKTWHHTGDSCVAISGPITGNGEGPINQFMTKQGILNPPKERLIYDTFVPQAIITANALVSGIAFSFIGGFDETFTEAAGEDLDLGLRLRTLGIIGWAENAVVKHRFNEDKEDFMCRFKRYGAGNRRLEVKHNLPSLRAKPYSAELAELQELADLQIEAMQSGYDGAVDQRIRGKIILPEDLTS